MYRYCGLVTPRSIFCYGLALRLPIRRALRPKWNGVVKNIVVLWELLIFLQKRPAGRADFLYKLNNRGKLLKVNVTYLFAIFITFSYDEFRLLFRLTYFDFGKEINHVTALLLQSRVSATSTFTSLSTTKAVLER